MAEDKPSLHIDTDWKKQAQEEKRKLAEQEAKRAEEREQRAASSPMGVVSGGMSGDIAAAPAGVAGAAPGGARARGQRGEMPQASLASLVQSVMTQVLYYLGDLAPRGAEPTMNLDMAKHHIDTLGVLEQKTNGNLSAEEQKVMDSALYETRMRFVSAASQLLGP
jgi:hypothetical protein